MVQDYAVKAMQWAIAEKLILGSNEQNRLYLNPRSSATRSQVAAILMRYLENTMNQHNA